ncbi:MAG: ATP-binding protein [Chitinispirillales bacterium]|jgi:hypothetical protein|nr:ATP-binding protein [Chitinispirillales bacterium]
MSRFFNVAGPCIPGKHYMLDPMRGMGSELMRFINSEQYFIIHAARQSGKTTLIWELANDINAHGKYHALYCSLEAIQEFTDPEKGIPEIVRKIASSIENQSLPTGFAKDADYSDTSGVLNTSLVRYCRSLDKPLVVFFDEADCLSDGTLITFLRQLREGYISKGRVPFVHSLALVGLRNLRDYKVRVRPDSESRGGASPFNIVTEYINLRNFLPAEVTELYAQHTVETGQAFEPEAVDYAFEQTLGQPWLVNAIAREATVKILREDYSKPVTRALVEQAIQNIILARGTHVDSLMERLRDPRIRKVIEPLILGDVVMDEETDDYQYTKDLGLIRENGGKVESANPIYAELIVRMLSNSVQKSISNTHTNYEPPRYMKDGRLDMDFLISDFQTYWRENSEIWISRYKTELYEYDEAAPHLVIQAFLQRVINGGGKIMREMALGTGRCDLCVVYGEQKYPIELKILQNMRKSVDPMEQLTKYMDKVGSNFGWLVIFDKDTKKNWDEKIYIRKEYADGKEITVAGC